MVVTLVKELADARDSREALIALTKLRAELLPPREAPSSLLDELSFDLFPPVMCSARWRQCTPVAASLLLAMAEVASPREVFCLIMDAFSNERAPRCQLLLLRLLVPTLGRLQRKRAAFLVTCLGSLHARFLEQWPGADWDDAWDAEQTIGDGQNSEEDVDGVCDDDAHHGTAGDGERGGGPEGLPSSRLVEALIHIAAISAADAAAAMAPSASPTERHARMLIIDFLLRTLELTSRHSMGKNAHATLVILGRCQLGSVNDFMRFAEPLGEVVLAEGIAAHSCPAADEQPIEETPPSRCSWLVHATY